MKGKLTLREPVISYTGVATPLTIDDIAEDIDELRAERALTPGEIRMWEHQWDYLVKEVSEWDIALEGEPRRVWGIDVVVMHAEKPAAPIAVLEVNHELTDEEAEEIRERFDKLFTKTAPFVATIRAEQQSIIDRVKEKVRK